LILTSGCSGLILNLGDVAKLGVLRKKA